MKTIVMFAMLLPQVMSCTCHESKTTHGEEPQGGDDGVIPLGRSGGLHLELEVHEVVHESRAFVELIVTLRNEGDRRIVVREPAGGTIFFYSREIGESFWTTPPPASYELPGLVEIPPGEERKFHFEEEQAPGIYEYYALYYSNQASNVNWDGKLRSKTQRVTVDDRG